MDDEEFGDFGGFEAAEPVGDRPAAQSQAQVSPWAAFASGNAQDRPDLLCAQNRFPTYLDPSNITRASADFENGNQASLQQAPPNADLLDGAVFRENIPQHNHVQAENIADVTLNVGAGVPFHQNQNMNGRLPDIGLGFNESHLFGPDHSAAGPSLSLEGEPVEEVHPGAPGEVDIFEEVAEVQHDGHEIMAQEVVPGAEAQPSVDRPQEHMQEQLDSLQAMNRTLEEELLHKQEELEEQRSRLEETERQHSETLEEVRSAGHNALSVVVEQYKEQTKTLIIEQQEAARIQLLEALNEQMKAFQDLLTAQRQGHEEECNREREEAERRIGRAVESVCKQEQEKFQVFLQEQQEKWKSDMAKALKNERTSCKEQFQEALKIEHDTAKIRLDEARVEYMRLLEEEKRTHEAALVKVREEEIKKTKEQISEFINEEKERSRDCVQKAVEAVKADLRTYVNDQHKADSRIRLRHLASLDLFLESARQQISHLMDSEKPDVSSNQSVSREASGPS